MLQARLSVHRADSGQMLEVDPAPLWPVAAGRNPSLVTGVVFVSSTWLLLSQRGHSSADVSPSLTWTASVLHE